MLKYRYPSLVCWRHELCLVERFNKELKLNASLTCNQLNNQLIHPTVHPSIHQSGGSQGY